MPYHRAKVVGTELRVATFTLGPVTERGPKKRNPRGHRRPDNNRSATNRLRDLIQANIDPHNAPFFVSLTYARNQTDISTANRHFDVAFKRLRRRFRDIKYIAVPEFQERGAVHFHCLIWPTPPLKDWLLSQPHSIYPVPRVLNRRGPRHFATDIWEHGFVDIVLTNNSKFIAYYISKYFHKTINDTRWSNKRVYRTSHNLKRPFSYELDDPDTPLFDEITLNFVPVDNPPFQTLTFATQWMGNCTEHYYNIENIYND